MADARSLSGHVCVVTGASRGAGRGIAVGLGARRATVYVTGRSDDLDATVSLVRAEGGSCTGVRCDHTVDKDVDALFARVRDEHGRLVLLMNNARGGYEQRDDAASFFDAPFWEQPRWRWEGGSPQACGQA